MLEYWTMAREMHIFCLWWDLKLIRTVTFSVGKPNTPSGFQQCPDFGITNIKTGSPWFPGSWMSWRLFFSRQAPCSCVWPCLTCLWLLQISIPCLLCLATHLLFQFDLGQSGTLTPAFPVGTHLVALPAGCFDLACGLQRVPRWPCKSAFLFPSPLGAALEHLLFVLAHGLVSDTCHLLRGSLMACFSPQKKYSSLFINCSIFNMSVNINILFVYMWINYIWSLFWYPLWFWVEIF